MNHTEYGLQRLAMAQYQVWAITVPRTREVAYICQSQGRPGLTRWMRHGAERHKWEWLRTVSGNELRAQLLLLGSFDTKAEARHCWIKAVCDYAAKGQAWFNFLGRDAPIFFELCPKEAARLAELGRQMAVPVPAFLPPADPHVT